MNNFFLIYSLYINNDRHRDRARGNIIFYRNYGADMNG